MDTLLPEKMIKKIVVKRNVIDGKKAKTSNFARERKFCHFAFISIGCGVDMTTYNHMVNPSL